MTPTAPSPAAPEPDEAYLLKGGQVTVADAQNCRVLVINTNRTVAHQIGTGGVCAHHPPASMGSPNGDTPLADGNLLVSARPALTVTASPSRDCWPPPIENHVMNAMLSR